MAFIREFGGLKLEFAAVRVIVVVVKREPFLMRESCRVLGIDIRYMPEYGTNRVRLEQYSPRLRTDPLRGLCGHYIAGLIGKRLL